MKTRRVLGTLASCVVLAALAACSDDGDSGSPPAPPPPASTFTVGGTVSGLSSGAKVTVQDNGGDGLTVSANGAFTFTTALAGGASYAVTISAQPAGESCKATSASGTVGSADVTSVAIACTVAPVATYSIGGTVSGLTGSSQVTIELNGADPLPASNGSFRFTTTLASGASYAVTIATQPSGATCALGNATGTIAAANVTNVGVSCTANGGGGGAGGAFWLPFSAAPVTGTTGGKAGMFLVASTAIGDNPAPAPSWVTTNTTTLLGLALNGFVNGSTLPTSETPAVMIYAAAGADGNTHLYGLNLAYTSATPPVPAQITNLSVPASMNVCSAGQLENDVATPTSLAVVAYVVTPVSGAKPGTEGYCPAGGTYELAHYTDAPTTAPVVVNIPGGTASFSALLNDGPFNALYQNAGNLAGVALWDSADGDLNFYPGETFAGPSTVVANTTEPVAIFSRTVEYGVTWTGGDNYLFSGTTTGTSAYRLNASGSAVAFFVGTVAGAVEDDNNLYFIGYQGSSATAAIYKEPLSFTQVADELSTAILEPSGSAGSTLLWSNDSVLIFENYSVSGAGSASYSLLSVPVGTTSTSATTIAGPTTGSLATAFMASPTGTDTAADILFLTTINHSGAATQFSSQVLSAVGSVAQTTPNAVLGSFNTLTTELLGDIWEIQGITDTSGGYGGGTLEQLNVGTLAKTAITATGGAAYTVPAGYGLSMTGFYGTSIAVAQLYSPSSPTAPLSAGALDVSQHVILPLSLANTNVSPML
jgi:hypothetical protein